MSSILAFSGSNSSTSLNQKLVTFAASHHTNSEVINLVDFDIPMFGVDLESEIGSPKSISQLKEKLDNSAGLIISTPEHNGSMPAFLKNCLDWLSRTDRKFFGDKNIFVLSTSPGAGGAKSALAQLEKMCGYFGTGKVISLSIPSFNENYISETEMSKEATVQIKTILSELF